MQMLVKYLFDNIPELVSNPDDSGYDIRAVIDKPLKIEGYGKASIPTGIAVEIHNKDTFIGANMPFHGTPTEYCPVTTELQVRPRSGHTRQGIVAQFGTIDSSYRGEIFVNIFNQNPHEIEIQPLERIAQLVVCPIFKPAVVKVAKLSNTDRGSNGFGSTGKD